MDRSQLRIDQIVKFGKPGNISRGKVEKLNTKTATIRATEPHKGGAIGELWTVDYNLIHPDDGKGAKVEPLKYNPFDAVENAILRAIVAVYGAMDNPMCDGEVTNMKAVMFFKRQHETQMKHLQAALGRLVTEEEAYKWDEQRKKQEKTKTA